MSPRLLACCVVALGCSSETRPARPAATPSADAAVGRAAPPPARDATAPPRAPTRDAAAPPPASRDAAAPAASRPASAPASAAAPTAKRAAARRFGACNIAHCERDRGTLLRCERACEADPRECGGLGDALLRGSCGLTRNVGRAIELYEKACRAGEDVACLSAAQALADRGGSDDVARGIRLYGPRCHEIGDARCEVLAQLLRQPSPLRDAPRALALYVRACGSGGYDDSPESCDAAAEMLEKGEVPADPKRAERLRRLAARIQKQRESEGR
ncbi:MAG TPA: hypothetical protein VGQ83_43320 [Polyangia bacterium]|jgi:TPR repeat protein